MGMVVNPASAALNNEVLMKMMYSWVCAVRYNMPTVPIQKAVSQFYKYYQVDEASFVTEKSAIRTYYRIDEQFKNRVKTDTGQKECDLCGTMNMELAGVCKKCGTKFN